ncbi:hypothetical protein U1Q18_046888 [Sarracenia purpurea var. burkii]
MSPSHVFVGRLSNGSSLNYKHVESGHLKESSGKGWYCRVCSPGARWKALVKFWMGIMVFGLAAGLGVIFWVFFEYQHQLVSIIANLGLGHTVRLI